MPIDELPHTFAAHLFKCRIYKCFTKYNRFFQFKKQGSRKAKPTVFTQIIITMPTTTRIPRAINVFNSYLMNTTAYLLMGSPSNAERLGVLQPEMDRWSNFLGQWTPLYSRYSDKKNSRTTAIKDQLLEIIGLATDFDQSVHFLDRIAASPNVTIVDMETFNIKKGVLQKTTRTVPVTPMTEAVVASIQPLGGGTAVLKCYTVSGQRASIYSGADSVQFLYQVGDTPPVSAEAPGLNKELSTKAIITLSLGAGSSGKNLYIYFRWYNTKHPELSGPWSALQTSLIL